MVFQANASLKKMLYWCLFADVPSLCPSANVTNSGLFVRASVRASFCDNNHLSVSTRRWGWGLDNGRGFAVSPPCWELYCPTFSFFPRLGLNASLNYLLQCSTCPPSHFYAEINEEAVMHVCFSVSLLFACTYWWHVQLSAPLQPRQCLCVLSLSCSCCCKN